MKKIIAMATIAAFVLSASTASAFHWSSSDINVNVSNDDTRVTNNVNTSASTGGNDANGGSANGKNATGGLGGMILTGHAWATSVVDNDVNSTVVRVETDCGCKGDIDVDVDNDDTTVTNNVNTSASTGYNDANGGSATGSGGWWWGGGSSTTGGEGGYINTGNADALASVVNVVNSTLVRVRR